MHPVDWFVIGLYVLIVIAVAAWANRYLHDSSDYYQTGRSMRWWQSGLSTMATQLSAVSFVSVPAFVAVAEGGGLRWLAYEFGLPLGILIVLLVLVPALTEVWPVSIYELLEDRVGRSTRRLVSGLFLLGRGLATGVIVLTGGLIVSTTLQINLAASIVIIGLITLVYDLIGGIRVVILSDVIQMGIIVVGLLACGVAAVNLLDPGTVVRALDPARYRILIWEDLGLKSGEDYGFWPMLIGGTVLYASYYGCDQSQMQRELSVRDAGELRGSLLLNALGRFPVVLLYCLVGLFVGAVLSVPEHAAEMADTVGRSPEEFGTMLETHPDRMLPVFILTYLPPGMVGLLFAGLVAALMSSLDSAVNSLSAVTVRDHLDLDFPRLKQRLGDLTLSRLTTVFWATFALTAALVFAYAGEATRETVVVLINQIGSVLYGPILGAFLLAVIGSGLSPRGVNIAVLGGVAVSGGLWLVTWQTAVHVSWLWWIPSGTLATLFLGLGAVAGDRISLNRWVTVLPEEGSRRLYAAVLIGWTAVIIFLSLMLERLLI